MLKRNFALALALTALVSGASGVAGATTARVADDKKMMSGDKMMMMSSSDKDFVMKAAHGGMMEIDMARVALDRSSSDDVKAYAQKMIDDHTKANDELMRVCSTKGMTMPMPMSASEMRNMETMKANMMKMSGADFDHHYMAMQQKDHMKMVKLFQGESMRGKDADLKAFAASTLPTVQMHHDMARDWNMKMKGMKGDMKGMKM